MNSKNLRAKVGMSQLELAFKSGVSRFRLYLIEKGYVNATVEEEARIREALNKKARSIGEVAP